MVRIGGAWIALVVVLGAGCRSNFAVPRDADIECSASAQCPKDWTCDVARSRCVALDVPRAVVGSIVREVGTVRIPLTVFDSTADLVTLRGVLVHGEQRDSVALVPAQVASAPTGRAVDVSWDAATFFGSDAYVAGPLVLEITPSDGHDGDVARSESFVTGNDAPELSEVRVEQVVRGTTFVQLVLADSSSDAVDVAGFEVLLAEDSALAVDVGSVGAGGAFPLGAADTLSAPSSGGTVTLAWDSRHDAPIAATGARLRVTVRDAFGAETTTTSEAFALENQTPPRVERVHVKFDGERHAGAVPIVYRIIDEQADAAVILPELSLDDGRTWLAASELPLPASQGLGPHESAPGFAGGRQHVFVWDSSRDLAMAQLEVRLRLSARDEASGLGPALEVISRAEAGVPATGTASAVTTETLLASAWRTRGMSVGDFDGDGATDVVATQGAMYVMANAQGVVAVAWGDGAGGSDETSSLDVGNRVIAVIGCDMDGDGADEVVTSSADDAGAGQVIVYAFDATRAATRVGSHAVTGAGVVLHCADLDNNGRRDLVLAEGAGAIHLVSLSGALLDVTTVHATVYPTVVATADLNNDARLDLIVGGTSVPADTGTARIVVLRRSELGRYGDDLSIIDLTDDTLRGLVAADFDQDADVDLIAAGEPWTNLVLLRNDAGTLVVLGERIQLPSFNATSLAVGTLDGDSYPDLIGLGASMSQSFLWTVRGVASILDDAIGTVVTPATVALPYDDVGTSYGSTIPMLASVAGTAAVDLVVPRERWPGVLVFADINVVAPSAVPTTTWKIGGYDREVSGASAAIDFDADGEVDLVTVTTEASWLTSPHGAFRIHRRHGPGDWRSEAELDVPYAVDAAAVADVDHDGDQDIVYATPNELRILRASPGGAIFGRTYTDVLLCAVTDSPRRLLVADLNADGLDELVLTMAGSSSVLWSTGGVYAASLAPLSIPGVTAPSVMSAVDVDGAGGRELVVVTPDDIVAVVGASGSSLVALRVLQSDIGVGDVVVGDFVGGPAADLVIVGSALDPTVVVFADVLSGGVGAANSLGAVAATLGSGAGAVVFDFDGDGADDIVRWSASPYVLLPLVARTGSVAREIVGLGAMSQAGSFASVNTMQAFVHPDGSVGMLWTGGGALVATRLQRDELAAPPALMGGGADLRAPGTLSALELADVDGDGAVDVLMTTEDRAVLEIAPGARAGWIPTGSFRPVVRVELADEPVAMVVGDAQGDAMLDVALLMPNGHTVVVVDDVGASLHEGSSTPTTTVLTTTSAQRIVAADLDDDGRDELICVRVGEVDIFAGSAAGWSDSPTSIVVDNMAMGSMSDPVYAGVADLDGDGALEVWLTVPNSLLPGMPGLGGLWRLQADGNASSGYGVTLLDDSMFVSGSLLTAELNGDGVLDFVSLDQSGAHAMLSVTAGYGPWTTFSGAWSGKGGAAFSLDADGLPDVVSCTGVWAEPKRSTTSTVMQVRGTLSVLPTSVGGLCRDVRAADLDGDGVTDLAVGAATGYVASGYAPGRSRAWWPSEAGLSVPRAGFVGALPAGSAFVLEAFAGAHFDRVFELDLARAVMRSAVAPPEPVAPLSNALSFDGDRMLVEQGPRLAVVPRLALDLEATTPTGVLVALPFAPGRDTVSSGANVYVVAAQLDWQRASETPGDLLFGQPAGDGVLPLVESAEGGMTLQKRAVRWRALAPDADGNLSTGAGERFIVDAEARVVWALLDHAGVVQALVER